MNLKELREKSLNILKDFVDAIGLDGEFYFSTCNCPISWGRPKAGGTGEYVTPGSKRLDTLLSKVNYDDRTKKMLNQRGLILIDSKYKTRLDEPDLFITIMHETLHSNRNLMLYDATREEKNENAYNFNDGRFQQNTSEYSLTYADASQDILKGNIDTARSTVSSYDNMTSDQIEDMEFDLGNRDAQMGKQQTVDEALVELMSVVAYKLYSNKQNGKSTNIWDILNETAIHFDGEDLGIMCRIIIKHQDLELFYWMLDPISYSQGDIHYDFFGNYTKNDGELLEELYGTDNLNLDEYLGFGSSSIKM